MNIKIKTKESFAVAGIDKQNISISRCPGVWRELYSKYSHKELADLGSGELVGVCHDVQNQNEINYLAGYIISNLEKAKGLGLDILEVPAANYAVVELTGPVPECIRQGWKYATETFMPEHGYRHSGTPDFEYYFSGDMSKPDYKMELWIPIVKA